MKLIDYSNNIYLIEFKRYIKDCVYLKKPIDFKIAKYLLYRYRGK